MPYAASHSTADAVSLAVTLAAVGLILTVVLLAAYWRTFTRAGERGWAAIVPFYSTWVLLRVARKPRWWFVLMFVPVANIVVTVLVDRAVARAFGRGAGFTAGLVLLPWVFWPVLAFGPGRYTAPDADVRTAPRVRAARGPWVVALAAAVVLAALSVAWVYVPSRNSEDLGGLTGEEQSAVTAAGTIAANVATFSRATFSKDFTRALDSTTGALHADLLSKRSTTQKTLTDGKFDVYARVQRSAFVGPIEPNGSGKAVDGFIVMIALNGYTTASPTTPNAQTLEVTVQKVKGQWLGSDVTSVGVQS